MVTKCILCTAHMSVTCSSGRYLNLWIAAGSLQCLVLAGSLQCLVSAVALQIQQDDLLFCRLAAAMGLQCALTLTAAQVQGATDGQVQELCWSAAEAAETFETVMWALSQYNDVLDSGAHTVANTLQQMELNEGDLSMHLL